MTSFLWHHKRLKISGWFWIKNPATNSFHFNLSAVFGILHFVFGVWCLVFDILCFVFGVWYLTSCIWCLVCGGSPGIRWLVRSLPLHQPALGNPWPLPVLQWPLSYFEDTRPFQDDQNGVVGDIGDIGDRYNSGIPSETVTNSVTRWNRYICLTS